MKLTFFVVLAFCLAQMLMAQIMRNPINPGVPASGASSGGGGGLPPDTVLLGNTTIEPNDYLANDNDAIGGQSGFVASQTAVPTKGYFYGYTELGGNGKFLLYSSTGGILCLGVKTPISGDAEWQQFTLNGCPQINSGTTYHPHVISSNFFHMFTRSGSGFGTNEAGGTYNSPANPGGIGAGDLAPMEPHSIYVTN